MKKENSHIFVANWKMAQSINCSISFFEDNKDELKTLTKNTGAIIVCPSFISIPLVMQEAVGLNVYIGAQTCSSFESGAYTGDISAQNLFELGCSFCIVGHSERRNIFGETNNDIQEKVEQLLKNKMIPIICVGETKEERESKKTEQVIQKQLKSILQSIEEKKYNDKPICIAYEPIWAIGTGVVPKKEELDKTMQNLQDFIKKYNVENHALLYGGSVNSKNVKELKTIKSIDGFLIGGASLDFQELKKIVLS